MHEMAFTQGILHIALTEAAKHQAAKVLDIRIKVGVLTGLLPEFVQEYFNIVSVGTVAEQSRLSIEKVPATIKCLNCGAASETEGFVFTCPTCNSNRIRLLGGREFYVDSLEVE